MCSAEGGTGGAGTASFFTFNEMNVQRHPSPTKKRTTNACYACRERKVKCSGCQPCSACTRRGDTCLFERADQRRISVSESYLNRLKRKSSQRDRDRSDRRLRSRDPEVESSREAWSPLQSPSITTLTEPQWTPGCAAEFLTNPLMDHSARYVDGNDGRKRYLGPSSSWNFSLQAWRLLNEALGIASSPLAASCLDGTAYTLDWPPTGLAAPDLGDMPTLDYAIYLVNTVKFHLGQLYHIFDESSFERRLRLYYTAGPDDRDQYDNIWLAQLLIVLAFGKAFLGRKSNIARPPGASYFERALELLPTVHRLYADPVTSIETYCAIALYEQSIEHRNSAYTHLGIALRVALSIGLHHEASRTEFDPQEQMRRRSAWWTVYVLELHFSALMGAPIAVQVDDISVSLPAEASSDLRATALCIHVKLSRILSEIIRTVYGLEGRLPGEFIPAIRTALRELATITSKIQAYFSVPTDGNGAISRVAATLNLTHHHCVTMATRPLILSILKHRLQRPQRYPASHDRVTSSVRLLLETSLSSAVKSIRILTVLLDQDLLESFTPFDLECVSSAATLYALVKFLAPDLITDDSIHTLSTNRILDAMIGRSSRPAEFRKTDLHLLDDVINQFRIAETPDTHGESPGDYVAPATDHVDLARTLEQAIPTYTPPVADDSINGGSSVYLSFAASFDSMEVLDPDQLLGIASLFDQAPGFLDEPCPNGNNSWLRGD